MAKVASVIEINFEITKDECQKYPSHCSAPDPCLGKILTCENWGTPDYDTCTCRCHPNFYGAMCEKAKCHNALTCENDGDFDPSTCTCACSNYFTGSRCEKYNCQAMGTRGRDSYRCARMPRRACTKGWHIRGEKEEIRLKYCPKKCGLC
ncbi:protein cueball-like [Lingula anatina]|uniref:Protein cueball-like n=1 Tax=Lingula anatina TaxID=7574 RepID=A0A1S3HFB8_LINAN|nr:protein cueball-like [Lingula anatina]|eukprot:XP_013384768.1 protein cueball-like [Lingula anatina]